jgi:2-keto-4-pentenoate hydratase/2-oxohepta-3-ene-1,7-dioic acid hydratase in catechol pathway
VNAVPEVRTPLGRHRRLGAKVNGELWSEGNTGSIFWKLEQMIEFVSRDETIRPGELIGSGAVGTGCGLELDSWMRPGDIVELEIDTIGVLRNRVVKKADGSSSEDCHGRSRRLLSRRSELRCEPGDKIKV